MAPELMMSEPTVCLYVCLYANVCVRVSAHVTTFNSKWGCVCACALSSHTHAHITLAAPQFHIISDGNYQSSISNQAINFGDTQIHDCLWCFITLQGSQRANCLVNLSFFWVPIFFGGRGCYILRLFFLPLPIQRLRWWISCCSHQTYREKPQRSGQWEEGGVEREGTVREKRYVGQWRIALGYCPLSSQSGKLIWFPVNPSDLNYERLPSLKITSVTAMENHHLSKECRHTDSI